MMRNAVIVASFVVQHREPRREAAAQAAAEGAAGTIDGAELTKRAMRNVKCESDYRVPNARP